MTLLYQQGLLARNSRLVVGQYLASGSSALYDDVFVVFTTGPVLLWFDCTFIIILLLLYQLQIIGCVHTPITFAFHVKLDRHNLWNYVNTFSISYHTSNILTLMYHIVDMWPKFYETSQWSDCFMIWCVVIFSALKPLRALWYNNWTSLNILR